MASSAISGGTIKIIQSLVLRVAQLDLKYSEGFSEAPRRVVLYQACEKRGKLARDMLNGGS